MTPHRHLYREEDNQFIFCEAIDFPNWRMNQGSTCIVHGTAKDIIFYHEPVQNTYWMVKAHEVSNECPVCLENWIKEN